MQMSQLCRIWMKGKGDQWACKEQPRTGPSDAQVSISLMMCSVIKVAHFLRLSSHHHSKVAPIIHFNWQVIIRSSHHWFIVAIWPKITNWTSRFSIRKGMEPSLSGSSIVFSRNLLVNSPFHFTDLAKASSGRTVVDPLLTLRWRHEDEMFRHRPVTNMKIFLFNKLALRENRLTV